MCVLFVEETVGEWDEEEYEGGAEDGGEKWEEEEEAYEPHCDDLDFVVSVFIWGIEGGGENWWWGKRR